MSPRSALLPIAALLPFLALPALGALAADRLGTRIGRELGRAAPALLPAKRPPAQRAPEPEPEPPAAEAPTEPAVAEQPVKEKRRGRRAPAAPQPAGIHVRAGAVLALAERGVIPSAEPVAAGARRPAGLVLRGVSGLGVGLRDGDVLSEVAGRPVRSLAQVVGLIIGQRARRAPVISGRIWRGDRPLTLSVEQPYSWEKNAPVLADSRQRG